MLSLGWQATPYAVVGMRRYRKNMIKTMYDLLTERFIDPASLAPEDLERYLRRKRLSDEL